MSIAENQFMDMCTKINNVMKDTQPFDYNLYKKGRELLKRVLNSPSEEGKKELDSFIIEIHNNMPHLKSIIDSEIDLHDISGKDIYVNLNINSKFLNLVIDFLENHKNLFSGKEEDLIYNRDFIKICQISIWLPFEFQGFLSSAYLIYLKTGKEIVFRKKWGKEDEVWETEYGDIDACKQRFWGRTSYNKYGNFVNKGIMRELEETLQISFKHCSKEPGDNLWKLLDLFVYVDELKPVIFKDKVDKKHGARPLINLLQEGYNPISIMCKQIPNFSNEYDFKLNLFKTGIFQYLSDEEKKSIFNVEAKALELNAVIMIYAMQNVAGIGLGMDNNIVEIEKFINKYTKYKADDSNRIVECTDDSLWLDVFKAIERKLFRKTLQTSSICSNSAIYNLYCEHKEKLWFDDRMEYLLLIVDCINNNNFLMSCYDWDGFMDKWGKYVKILFSKYFNEKSLEKNVHTLEANWKIAVKVLLYISNSMYGIYCDINIKKEIDAVGNTYFKYNSTKYKCNIGYNDCSSKEDVPPFRFYKEWFVIRNIDIDKLPILYVLGMMKLLDISDDIPVYKDRYNRNFKLGDIEQDKKKTKSLKYALTNIKTWMMIPEFNITVLRLLEFINVMNFHSMHNEDNTLGYNYLLACECRYRTLMTYICEDSWTQDVDDFIGDIISSNNRFYT